MVGEYPASPPPGFNPHGFSIWKDYMVTGELGGQMVAAPQLFRAGAACVPLLPPPRAHIAMHLMAALPALVPRLLPPPPSRQL